MAKLRLWRVDAIHKNGYHAPYLLVETEKDEDEFLYKITKRNKK